MRQSRDSYLQRALPKLQAKPSLTSCRVAMRPQLCLCHASEMKKRFPWRSSPFIDCLDLEFSSQGRPLPSQKVFPEGPANPVCPAVSHSLVSRKSKTIVGESKLADPTNGGVLLQKTTPKRAPLSHYASWLVGLLSRPVSPSPPSPCLWQALRQLQGGQRQWFCSVSQTMAIVFFTTLTLIVSNPCEKLRAQAQGVARPRHENLMGLLSQAGDGDPEGITPANMEMHKPVEDDVPLTGRKLVP